MNKYYSNHNNVKDVVNELIIMVENQTKKDIFTLAVTNNTDEGLETIIVFEDKSILIGLIVIEKIRGEMSIRIKGNYV